MAGAALVSLAAIAVLGIGAHWLAWRARMAPILFFIAIGFIAGPLTGLLRPDELLGDLLEPVVALGVAVILFEGGLTLRFPEVQHTGSVVTHLVTVGVLVTWLASAAAAHFILDLSIQIALLLGSILVVSGPTVVGPLLRFVRPRGPAGSVLKWEGIVIDPVGALLAILVFDAVILGDPARAFSGTILSVGKAVIVGGLLGVLGAIVLGYALYRHWVPDYLQSAVSLMFVISVFVAADVVQSESGLFAVTLMGLLLANQPYARIYHILEFKETLRLLIIPSLFILLTARLTLTDLQLFGPAAFLFLGVVVLLVRPLTVLLATRGSPLSWKDRAFVAGMMPRGIVAAAIASVFGLRLATAGIPDAEKLAPYAFLVIVGTGIIYSLTSLPLARVLGLAGGKTGEILIVGANLFGRRVAQALQRAGFQAHIIDTNRNNVTEARYEELRATRANALSEHVDSELSLERVSHVLVLTPNDETNILAARHLADYVGTARAFQLPLRNDDHSELGPSARFVGRVLFHKEWNYRRLTEALREGWTVRATKITTEFTYDDYRAKHLGRHVPLFLGHDDHITPFTVDEEPEVYPGTTLIALVADAKPAAKETKASEVPAPPPAAATEPSVAAQAHPGKMSAGG